MKWARSLASVLAGYAVLTAALRVCRLTPMGGSLTCFTLSAIAGAIAGGFLTAWLAGSHEVAHAAGLGFLIVAIVAFSMRLNGVAHPGWYEIAIAGCGPIATLFGAALRMLTKRVPVTDTPDP